MTFPKRARSLPALRDGQSLPEQQRGINQTSLLVKGTWTMDTDADVGTSASLDNQRGEYVTAASADTTTGRSPAVHRQPETAGTSSTEGRPRLGRSASTTRCPSSQRRLPTGTPGTRTRSRARRRMPDDQRHAADLDNDQGGTTPTCQRNNSVTTLQDPDPLDSSYSCQAPGGELSWNATTKRPDRLRDDLHRRQREDRRTAPSTHTTGSATIYVSGTLLCIKNSKLCQATGLGRATCTTHRLESGAEMLAFVVNGNGSGGSPQSQVTAGDSVRTGQRPAQGALYGTNAIEFGHDLAVRRAARDGSIVCSVRARARRFPASRLRPGRHAGQP